MKTAKPESASIRISKQVSHIDIICDQQQYELLASYIRELYTVVTLIRKLNYLLISALVDSLTHKYLKLIIHQIMPLSFLICERFCKIINPSGIVSLEEFIEALKIICLGSLEDKIFFVFRMYDFDNDGYIVPEDVKLLLSHIPMANREYSDCCFDFFNENQRDIKDTIKGIFSGIEKLSLKEFTLRSTDNSSDMFFAVSILSGFSVYTKFPTKILK